MQQSLTDFPVNRGAEEGDLLAARHEVYDPLYLLALLGVIVKKTKVLLLKELVESDLVGYAILALTSRRKTTRLMSASGLAALLQALENDETHKDKLQVALGGWHPLSLERSNVTWTLFRSTMFFTSFARV